MFEGGKPGDKSHPGEQQPMPGRTASVHPELRAHQEWLGGLCPIQIWVPDVRSPEFLDETRRQSRLANASPEEAEIQAFIDSVSISPDDDSPL
jgi:hypothetical protein